MAALNTIAKEWADELRDGIAWLIVWKTGRSWNAQAVWLSTDNDTFEPEDLELVHEILEKDPKAVMVNGYYCGYFGEEMNVAELAAGIRWHYENGCNMLDGSTAFPPESVEFIEESLVKPCDTANTEQESAIEGYWQQDTKANQQHRRNSCAVVKSVHTNSQVPNRQSGKLLYRHSSSSAPLLPSSLRGPPESG